MSQKLAEIARRLGMPPQELRRKSVLSFVAQEIRPAESDIADIKERYGVSSWAELEDGIKGKAIYSHPAWEDLSTGITSRTTSAACGRRRRS